MNHDWSFKGPAGSGGKNIAPDNYCQRCGMKRTPVSTRRGGKYHWEYWHVAPVFRLRELKKWCGDCGGTKSDD